MNLAWAMTKRIDISCPCSHTLPSFLVGFWHLKTGEVFGWSRLEKTIPNTRGSAGSMPRSIPILGTQIWPTSRSFWRSFCGFTLYLGRKQKRWIRGDSLWWSSSETFARNMFIIQLGREHIRNPKVQVVNHHGGFSLAMLNYCAARHISRLFRRLM